MPNDVRQTKSFDDVRISKAEENTRSFKIDNSHSLGNVAKAEKKPSFFKKLFKSSKKETKISLDAVSHNSSQIIKKKEGWKKIGNFFKSKKFSNQTSVQNVSVDEDTKTSCSLNMPQELHSLEKSYELMSTLSQEAATFNISFRKTLAKQKQIFTLFLIIFLIIFAILVIIIYFLQQHQQLIDKLNLFVGLNSTINKI